MRCANSNCEERLPPNASFSIDVRRSESRADRSPHPCDSGLRTPSNPSRKAVTSSGTPFQSPDPTSLLQKSPLDEGLSPMVDIPPCFRTRRRRRASKWRWDANAYQAFSDERGRAFPGSHRNHPRDVPAAIAERRPTGKKPHSTSPSRSANAPTSPSARLEQAKIPAQEQKSIQAGMQPERRSDPKRTALRTEARIKRGPFANTEAPSSSQLRSGDAALL